MWGIPRQPAASGRQGRWRCPLSLPPYIFISHLFSSPFIPLSVPTRRADPGALTRLESLFPGTVLVLILDSENHRPYLPLSTRIELRLPELRGDLSSLYQFI